MLLSAATRDGVGADERRFLRASDEWGNPLQASELALGAVGLVGPMPPHDMAGRQPRPLR